MAMMAEEFQISENGDPPILKNDPDKRTSHLVERETKKQRLRELRETHDCVRSIVNHMGKYYRTSDPPAWLDLRLVAGQILRSGATRRNSSHAAWKYLRDSMTLIHAWMDGHDTWKDAVEVIKMPHLGFRSEIKATEFIDSKSGSVPKCLMNPLKQIKLDFLMDSQPPSNDNTPYFWRGSAIDDPVWRNQFMQKQTYYHHIPFDDDLTDLVLSVVCRKGKAELENTQPLPGDAGAYEEDERFGLFGKGTAATADAKPSGFKDNDRAWEDKVQATMTRIAATVNDALAAEKAKLLGKRNRQENEKVQVENPNKRHKPMEAGPQQQKVMDSIEDSDDDDRLPTPPFAKASAGKEDEKYRALKAGYKKLKKQDQQLVSLYSSLDDNSKKQGKDVEQLSKQQKDLRKDTNANKQKQQQLAEQIVGLETENKSLEEKTQQLTVQCAALTDDVRKLEDKSGQADAQRSALEDENKILRCQLVSLITRVEALESAPKPTAEPVQTATSGPVSAPKPAEESTSVHSRQHFVVEATRNGAGPGPRDIVHGAAAPTVPSPQWQSAGSVKYEHMDGLSMDQPPQRHYKRAGSRFPRVLDMPTFDPSWNPQREILGCRTSGYARFSQRTTYSDTVYATNNTTTSYPYPDPAGRAPSPASNPAQQPVPTDIPAPIQPSAPTPSPMPTQSPLPVSAPVSAHFSTQAQHPTAAPANPLPCLRPEFSSAIDPSLYPTATVHPQYKLEVQTHVELHQPTVRCPNPIKPGTNHNNNYNHNPTATINALPNTSVTSHPPLLPVAQEWVGKVDVVGGVGWGEAVEKREGEREGVWGRVREVEEVREM